MTSKLDLMLPRDKYPIYIKEDPIYCLLESSVVQTDYNGHYDTSVKKMM